MSDVVEGVATIKMIEKGIREFDKAKDKNCREGGVMALTWLKVVIESGKHRGEQ
jgi:hypothetical protein